MKLLLVGSDKVFAIENFYVKHLRAKGESVVHYPAQTIFNDYYRKNFFNKVIFRAGCSGIYASINRELVEIARMEKPDIVWVFKGMEIFPSTLRSLRKAGMRLVNFNGDNPFIFSGRGSGNENITASLNCYDLHLTYNNTIHKEFLNRGLNAAILPFGFDLDQRVYEACQVDSEINRLCFLGNPDYARAAFIQSLAANGIPVTVYGNSWSKYLRGSLKVEINLPVYGEELWRVLRRYRVQLNLMRRHNPDSHNMRTFEVPGIGGIMLAPDTLEHRSFFEDGREAFFFKQHTDCVELATRLLTFSRAKADEVRTLARRRSILSGYRYEDRTLEALQLFDKYL